jgi:hypothetical protein
LIKRPTKQQVGIMAVARRYVDEQLTLSSVQSEVVMGSLNLIAAFGGLIAGQQTIELESGGASH